jgi:hypothetical protein
VHTTVNFSKLGQMRLRADIMSCLYISELKTVAALLSRLQAPSAPRFKMLAQTRAGQGNEK